MAEHTGASSHAIWKGTLTHSDMALPVKLYSAVQNNDLQFHLLHDQDHVRVEQRMCNPQTGEPVTKQDMRRGFSVDAHTLVVLSDAELAGLAAPSSRAIQVEQFVPRTVLAPRWFERPYYLAPDGAAEDYAAWVQALTDSPSQGVARWVMRKKHYIGVLFASRGRLLLTTLHFNQEVLEAPVVEPADQVRSDPRELDLADHLISALSGKFDPDAFHDLHRTRVLEFIEAKAKGRVVHLKTWKPRRKRDGSLSDTLQASLKALGTKRPKAQHA